MAGIKSVTIHNFRSIKEAKFNPYNYAVLVGANNAGKSNVFMALRIFYEDEIKFNEKTDFPKFRPNFQTEDNESWIEIEYLLTEDEYNNLRYEYRNPGKILKVRKYLKGSKVRPNQSNIYGYENSILSENLFYGAKNISEAKLGTVVYIPEVSKTDETLKLSGPSPLRNMLTFVMKRVVKTSDSFGNLNEAFEVFNSKFKGEESKDGFSLSKLREEINDSLKEWEVELRLEINPISPEDIIKNLVSHYTIDKNLDKEIDIGCLGQGLQRHLIYTLLKISPQYKEKKIYEKKEFSLDLNLILFEEPEAFLHPSQQESLDFSLKALSLEEGQQVIISTHSPIFVSNNINDIPSLIKLKRENGITNIFQVSENTQNKIISGNNELAQLLRNKLKDASVGDDTKKRIKHILGDTDDATRMEEESIRYLLWLDAERCCAFFADIVLICEGATEKVFIDYLRRNKWDDIREKRIYVLDTMGKFNIHRYMNLFKELGINHSVLADRDEDENVHEYINQFIEDQKNDYTRSIDFFDKDIECFLGIDCPPRDQRYKRPLNVMCQYFGNKIGENEIEELKSKVERLLEGV